MEVGCGDRRTMGPCGPVSLLYAAMNKSSCLKGEGEDWHQMLSSDLHTCVSISASILTYTSAQKEEEAREKRRELGEKD